MVWKNLDLLASFNELKDLEKVDLAKAMTGENGAKRVIEYKVPMSNGMVYSYAAKQVDDKILDCLQALADEAQLTEKY